MTFHAARNPVLAVLIVSSAVLVSARAARADDLAADFGAPGTVALAGSLSASISRNESPTASSSDKMTRLSAIADVFVARQFSLGFAGSFAYLRSTYPGSAGADAHNRMYTGAAALRVGYYVPLGERVGFWPVVAATLESGSSLGDSIGQGDRQTKSIDVIAQIVFHVSPHWYLRVEPAFVGYSTTHTTGSATYFAAPSLGFGFGGAF